MALRAPVLMFLDPGTIRLGWCVGTGAQLPTAGAWRFAHCGDDLGQLLDVVDVALNQHIDTYRPDQLGYESPILTRFDKLQSIRKTYALGALIELVCRRRGIPCTEVDLHDVKAALAGYKAAQKDEMVDAALRLGIVLPAAKADGREDAADAVGGWKCLLQRHSPVIASRYDAALHRSDRVSLI